MKQKYDMTGEWKSAKKEATQTTLQNDNGFTPEKWEAKYIYAASTHEIVCDGKRIALVLQYDEAQNRVADYETCKQRAELMAQSPTLKAENEKLRNDVKVLRDALNEYIEIEKENHGMMPVILRPATKKIIQALNQTKQS